MSKFSHIPVLLNEAIEFLDIKKGNLYVDATAGGGGHTERILEQGGKVLAIDQDQDAIEFLKDNFSEDIKNGNLKIEHDNFAHLKFLAKKDKTGVISGVLFDLGVSSYQIDNSGRGFSFKRVEPLDMRMGAGTLTAAEIINSWSKSELEELFQTYGEEHNAYQIVNRIIERRKKQRFENSKDLADVISKVSHKDAKIHPATLVFQALRIAVNNELNAEKEGLLQAFELLEENGRIVVISFHSLEDRIAKQQFANWERKRLGKLITKKPVVSGSEEVRRNKRARSAKLRVFEKK